MVAELLLLVAEPPVDDPTLVVGVVDVGTVLPLPPLPVADPVIACVDDVVRPELVVLELSLPEPSTLVALLGELTVLVVLPTDAPDEIPDPAEELLERAVVLLEATEDVPGESVVALETLEETVVALETLDDTVVVVEIDEALVPPGTPVLLEELLVVADVEEFGDDVEAVVVIGTIVALVMGDD